MFMLISFTLQTLWKSPRILRLCVILYLWTELRGQTGLNPGAVRPCMINRQRGNQESDVLQLPAYGLLVFREVVGNNRQIETAQYAGVGFTFKQEFEGTLYQFVDCDSSSSQLVCVAGLHGNNVRCRSAALHGDFESQIIQFFYANCWHRRPR